MSDEVRVHPSDQVEAFRASGDWRGPTLAEEVQRWAAQRPDALAVVDGSVGREVTYAELWDDVARLAGWLQDRGVSPGDGVSVQLPSRYETVVVDLAVLAIGARLNPLLPNYRRKELASFLRVSHAKAFVTPATYRGFDHAVLGAELVADTPGLAVHLVVDDAVPAGYVGLDDALRHEPLTALPALDPTAVSELIFTSGTESQPKAVMHTEETTNHSARSSYAHLGLGDDDVVWMPSPVGHSTGFNFGVRMALLHGIPVVLQDRWEPDLAAELIEKYRCTYTLAAATFLTDLLRSARAHGRDLSSMRVFGCGGAPVATELVREAADLGVTVLRIYGSTEGLILSWNTPSAPLDKRLNTDGLPPGPTRVQAWDDRDRVLAPGEVGELMIHGPNVCVGFFDDPERTRATFTAEGWLHSGDLGTVDEDGFVTVVGRKKETIIRGGLNIAPREIEDQLVEMPGVREVAVIGVADPRLGEIVGACIVPEDGAAIELADVVSFLEGRDMAKYKLPQYLQLMNELPRTPTGKVRKTELSSAATRHSSEGA